VPKSGSPVLGHIDVNSGHSMSMSKSRSGRGFGNVSIAVLDITEKSVALRADFLGILLKSR
jgi:hypothetical protein